jgi:hypothetical protein
MISDGCPNANGKVLIKGVGEDLLPTAQVPVSNSKPEEANDTAPYHASELEEFDDTAADHGSQTMGESASVEGFSAEVRVLQVRNGQITRSIYRQLDEAPPERFQPFGRVKDKKRIPKEWGQPKGGVLQLVGRDSKTRARFTTTHNRQTGRPQMGRRSSHTG